MYMLQLVCWILNCVIVTYIQVTVGVWMWNWDICTGYSWCVNVELWHMYRLQLVCWMWNCVIQLASVCFGRKKCQCCFGWNNIKSTEIVRILFCECDKIRYSPPCYGLKILMWQFKFHTTHFVAAGFGEYYVSLVFITSCLLWAVVKVALQYSNTAPHKYAQFTQRIHLCILSAFDIWMFNILQLFLAISNDPHRMLLTSAHYCSQVHLIYVTLNWRYALCVSG